MRTRPACRPGASRTAKNRLTGGDPAEVEKAKVALRSAAIGYVLAVLAPVIVTVLKSLVGG